MIISIDGPTASGKSTLAALLAEELGVYYVSSGMLYRALGYILLHYFKYDREKLVNPDRDDIKKCLNDNNFAYNYTADSGATVFYNGENITPYLKSREIDAAASLIAANNKVREELLKFQRSFAKRNSVVMEGRDIGSVIFPQADFKFFVTARPNIRAERWRDNQSHKGFHFTFEESLEIITERDTRDREREVSPLKIPDNALVIDTSELNIQEALQKILLYIRS